MLHQHPPPVAWRRQQEVGEKCAFRAMALDPGGGRRRNKTGKHTFQYEAKLVANLSFLKKCVNIRHSLLG